MESTTPLPDKAQKAMAAIKATLLSLGLALKAGFRYGSTTQDWTGERVDKELGVLDAALKVLRQMDENGQVGSKGVEVEKAGQAVVARSIALGMVSLSS
jgi:hypothetical protein